MHEVAPSASALTMSPPRRTPPSQTMSRSPPTASATGATRSTIPGAESSWRPPWLDSTMPSSPPSRAITASATLWTPLTSTGPSHSDRIHSTSSHDSVGSNCSFMKAARSTAVDPSMSLLPATFAKEIGSEKAKRRLQLGRNMPSNRMPMPILGGSVKPRRTSRSRRPSMAASTVMHSTSKPAAFARRIISSSRPLSRHT